MFHTHSDLYERRNFDDTDSESNDDDGDIKPSPTPQSLPIDDGDGHSHRLVDKEASDGDSISLAIAALTCGIARQGVMMNVASDTLQQWARFETYNFCMSYRARSFSHPYCDI